MPAQLINCSFWVTVTIRAAAAQYVGSVAGVVARVDEGVLGVGSGSTPPVHAAHTARAAPMVRACPHRTPSEESIFPQAFQRNLDDPSPLDELVRIVVGRNGAPLADYYRPA